MNNIIISEEHQYYKDVTKLKANPQLLVLRLMGDADEISQLIQILRSQYEGGLVKSVREDQGFTIVRLSRRIYAKSLLWQLAQHSLTKIQVMKSVRTATTNNNTKRRARNNNNNHCSDSSPPQQAEDYYSHNSGSKENDSNKKKKKPRQPAATNSLFEQQQVAQKQQPSPIKEEKALTTPSIYSSSEKHYPHPQLDVLLLDLIKVIFVNKFDYDQLLEFIVNGGNSSTPPSSDTTNAYMKLMIQTPYCSQIDKALETVSKCKPSHVRQLKNSFAFKTDEDDDKSETPCDEELLLLKANNNRASQAQQTPLQKVVVARNDLSPYNNKKIIQITKFPDIGRTQESVQKDIALKQQQFIRKSATTGNAVCSRNNSLSDSCSSKKSLATAAKY